MRKILNWKVVVVVFCLFAVNMALLPGIVTKATAAAEVAPTVVGAGAGTATTATTAAVATTTAVTAGTVVAGTVVVAAGVVAVSAATGGGTSTTSNH